LVISLAKQFNFLILLSTLSLLIPYFVSSTAALTLILKQKANVSKGRFIYVLIIAGMSSLYAFWTFTGVGKDTFFYGCLFFFATFWFYLGVRSTNHQ